MVIGAVHSSTLLELVGAEGEDEDDGMELLELVERSEERRVGKECRSRGSP